MHNLTRNSRNSTANSINGSYQTHRDKFIERLTTVFCQGSGIPLETVRRTLEFVSDTETTHGGDVSYPIHEALGWHLARFGYQARPNQYAALIRNWDGSVWQAILDTPERDEDRVVRPYTYRAPVKAGDRAYLTPILDWQSIIRDTTRPIVITEGAKKALSLLTLGDYAPIALYGCSCGTRGGKGLIPDLAQFRWTGRRVVIALDRDTKPTARRAVLKGTHRLARLLSARGAKVSIAQWGAAEGKGIDDLLVNRGIDRVKEVLTNATDYQLWKLGAYRLCTNPYAHVSINTQWLPSITDLTKDNLVFIRSYLGSGKTERLKEWIKQKTEEDDSVSFICLYHRVSLAASSAEKFGFDLITGQRQTEERQIEDERVRVCLCIDSLSFVNTPNGHFYLIIDEVSKVSEHLLGDTCKEKYSQLVRHLQYLARHPNCLGVVGLDADLDRDTVKLFESILEEPITVVDNEYRPSSWNITLWDKRSALLRALWEWVANGDRVFVPCATKADANVIYRKLVSQGVRTLLLTADNSGERESIEFKNDPNKFLGSGAYQVVVASPTISEGVSIVGDYFDRVVGFFPAKSLDSASVCQFIRRVRAEIPRDIWVSEGEGSTTTLERVEHWHSNQLRYLEARHNRTIPMLADEWREYAIQLKVRRRRELANLRAAVYSRLLDQGYTVAFNTSPHCPETWREWTELKKQVQWDRAQAIANADLITLGEYQAIKRKINRGIAFPEERDLARRFELWERYALLEVSPELVQRDNGGREHRALLRAVAMIGAEWARTKDREYLDMIAQHGAVDTRLPRLELTGLLLRELGMLALVERFAKDKGYKYCQESTEITAIAEKARALAHDVLELLGVTVGRNASPTEIVGRLLLAIGVKTKVVERKKGTRWYGLDPDDMGLVVQLLKGMLSKGEFRGLATSGILHSLIETWWRPDLVPPPKPPRWSCEPRYKSPPYRQGELNL